MSPPQARHSNRSFFSVCFTLSGINVMSRWSLRWHFTNKSLTGASYSIKVTVSSGFTLSTSYQSLRIQLACFYVDSISALMIQLWIIDVAFLVTVLVDPWPWSVTLTLSPKWAMVITHTHTKGQRLGGLLVQKLKWKQTFLCVFSLLQHWVGFVMWFHCTVTSDIELPQKLPQQFENLKYTRCWAQMNRSHVHCSMTCNWRTFWSHRQSHTLNKL